VIFDRRRPFGDLRGAFCFGHRQQFAMVECAATAPAFEILAVK